MIAMIRQEIASAILNVSWGGPLLVTEAVAQALDPIIVQSRAQGYLDQANYLSEAQRAIRLRYPHRRFLGLWREPT